ncbi:DUF2493 domain-containing protein [Pleomorphomonas oryzae]|uniref:DUF2493 domain-containing protein n=1 Tax=Pleomorphomonas oryzae TaxID=261934 RepID=UPI00040B22F5|nr:DUF2493 domain-containing protein [Pleomorphomonas oryzae]
MTRVLVCGGRTYGVVPPRTPKDKLAQAEATATSQRWRLEEVLDAAVTRLGLSVVIEGEQAGADTLSSQWAQRRGIAVEPFPADWDRYGKTAGPIRNARMLAEGRPDVVIAFPGRFGTWDMVDKATRAGVRTIIIDRAQWPNERR